MKKQTAAEPAETKAGPDFESSDPVFVPEPAAPVSPEPPRNREDILKDFDNPCLNSQQCGELYRELHSAPVRDSGPPWISVKEREPEIDQPVLVVMEFDDGSGLDRMLAVRMITEIPYRHWRGVRGMEVTHWQSLPKFPDEGQPVGTADKEQR